MIGILNIGGNKLGISKYQVIIHSRNGDELICEFEHNRPNGLGKCLLEASKAVEKSKWENG